MSTNIRPAVSKNNQYYISKDRYYELKHFCLQYPEWKHIYSSLSPTRCYAGIHKCEPGKGHSTPTENIAVERAAYSERISMIEKIAEETDKVFSVYILMAVTEGYTYPQLKARFNVPCGKDMFYEMYRKFFWILDKTRN